ncbi:MAG: hypothetical protein K0S65_5933, partial [Labilithrix sp.]|nr:hypothetical protein [Labilithrix sp.]
MRRARALRGVGSAVLVAGLIAAAACGDDRSGFVRPPELVVDASTPDGPSCGFQCSIDGRSVVQTCTGEVVETCPPELACGAARCQEPCAAAAEDRSSNGCEFFFQMPRFSALFPQSCYATFVVNSSTKPITLSLDREGQPLDISKALFRTNPGETTLIPLEGPIPPGESAILFVADRPPNSDVTPEADYIPCPTGVVPAALVNLGTGTRLGTAFHLKSSAPVGAVAMYPFGGAASYIPSATLLFPVATWGNEHLIVNGWESVHTGDPAAQIVASEDDTEVTVNPTTDIQNGFGVAGTGARVPMTYRLGKGEFLQLVQTEELSGSVVSSNKPTTVFGGHGCGLVPSRNGACDILNQQLPPFEQWGNEYVGVGYRPRLLSEREPMPYRIVAARDGTVLDYDPAVPPGAPITLSAGEVVTFTSGTGDAFVVRSQDAEHPFYLAAYMSGCSPDFGGRGDPEFVNVVAAKQYLSSYSFYADPTYKESSLVVVRAKTGDAFKDVWLECAGNLTGFQPIGTRGDYEFTRVDLARNGGPGATFGDKTCRNGLQRMR